MKKIIRLTESDLTRVVKQVIKEQQLNESKKLKNLALGLGLTASIMLPACSGGKHSEENDNKQTIIFMEKLNNLDEVTPEEMIPTYIETIEKDKEIFKNWDEDRINDMINSQISAFYRIDSKEHIELCAEMIAYQLKKCGQDKKVEIQVEEYVEKLKGGKLDRIDSLILKSFDVGVESLQKQIEYESESGYLR